MTMIDLAFEIAGKTIPLDHGYSLFSAVSRMAPQLHGDGRIGIHPIRGRRSAPGILSLIEMSRLRLRLPSEELAPYIALAGSELDLEGHRIRVGIPRVESLVPAASLASRLVTIRGVLNPTQFETHVRRRLAELGIAGEPSLVPSTRPPWTNQPLRRVMTIKASRIVGYAMRISGLTAEESLWLQEKGMGGRRRMGCGVFVPMERRPNL